MNMFSRRISLTTMKKLTTGLLFFVFVILLIGLLLSRGIAKASPVMDAGAGVTCANDGCTGLDPYKTGCANFFYTLLAKNESSGLLRVELEYSPQCHTKWTQAYWLDQVKRPLGADIIRQKGSNDERGSSSNWTDGGIFWWINTNQVWAPNNASEACAYAALVGTGPYPGVCVSQR